MIDATFRNTNSLFVLSFKNGDDHPARNYFDNCCMPLGGIQLLRLQLGRRGVHQNENVCQQGEGGVSYQCKHSDIIFFH